MSVRIAAKLPDGDADGLQAVEKMIRTERRPIVAVVVLRPKSVADMLDRPDDPADVVLAIHAVEVLLDDDAEAATLLLQHATVARTGVEPLPFGDKP